MKENKTQNVDTSRQQKLEYAIENFKNREVPQPQVKKKKTGWIMPLVLLIAIGIGVYLILEMSSNMGGEQKSFYEVFSAIVPTNAIIAVGVLFSIIFLDSAKYSIILHATTKKIRPLTSLKVSLLGRYYDNITPFATGGQPMQIYYLCKKGYSGGHSSAVIMIKYAFNTTAWLLIALVCMACNTGVLSSVENGSLLLIAGWIGWGINSLVPVFILTFVLMPKFARKLARGVVHIGHQMRFVKDEEKVLARAEGIVNDFRSAFIIMGRRPVHLVLVSLACLIDLSLTFALPYFIIKMLNGFSADAGFATMFEVMALNAYAAFSASVVPTPGNSGALEGLLTMAFSSMAGATLTWVVFTWRFAVYYLYIIIGVGITIFNFVRNIVRQRRAKAAANGLSQVDVAEDSSDTSAVQTPPYGGTAGETVQSQAVAVICTPDDPTEQQ